MTVAALLLSTSADEALTPIDGRPLIRRLVDAAWAGGAVPVIVSVDDPAGDVAAALAGAPATLVPRGDALDGIAAAVREVSETNAVMVWPTAYAWVDPETLTSLIEGHGVDREAILRAACDGTPGWPVLLPLTRLSGADPLADLGSARLLDLGDPGTIHDSSTPRSQLPRYLGPAGPTSGLTHEWGSPAGQEPDPG
jgi:CTP:molybdopterin cytidylyltransferase MocA